VAQAFFSGETGVEGRQGSWRVNEQDPSNVVRKVCDISVDHL
jgi:hypothetical protein